MSAASLTAHAIDVDAPGGRALVRGLGLHLGHERVALVGRNGVGKSSLLAVLAGRDTPRAGTVVRRGRLEFVPQDLTGAPGSSPGERRRQALLRALESEPEILLLDEPTRDLDAGGVDWLEARLAAHSGALLCVTHERRLLRGFRLFFVLSETGGRAFQGSFDELVAELARLDQERRRDYAESLTRLIREERHTASVCRRRERKKNVGRVRELRRCPSRIRLNGKRSYKQVSQATRALLQASRLAELRESTKAFRRVLTVALPLEIELPLLRSADGRALARLSGVSAGPVGRPCFTGLDLELSRDRLALVGPSGSGKSTLLDVLAGARRPSQGRAWQDPARVGYVAQNAANFRTRDNLVDRLVGGQGPLALERTVALLQAHGFPLALAERPLASLSPGERVRAALICVFARSPAVELLLLDEPTDDLDLGSVLDLTRLLRGFRGGLVVASHDAEFLVGIGVTRWLELGAGAWSMRSARAE